MSEMDEMGGTEDATEDRVVLTEADRLDLLLSASLDGELSSEEQAELETLLARDANATHRLSAFREIDQQLNRLAGQSVSAERLAATYSDLRQRLDLEGSDASPVATPWPQNLRRGVVPALVAAAAACLFYLAVSMDQPVEEVSYADAGESTDEARGLSADVEDELILVLGYGEDMSEITGITSDDLDVIEQLELLDFLSTREDEVLPTEERG